MSVRDERLLSTNVANRLKKKIIDGDWKINEQIPNEQELADEMMVSRTTIREAIKSLASQNIVRIERGKGTFVAETPGVVEDPLGFEFVPKQTLIRDLCEYRVAMEPVVSRLAAGRASGEQLREMEGIIKTMEQREKELSIAEDKNPLIDQLADLDAAFHTLLYGMTHNIVFERMTPVINDVIFENYYTKLYRNREQRLNAAETHRSLYQAIKNGDGQGAYALSKCHMEIMRDEICGEFLPRQEEIEYEKTDQQTGGLREGNHGGNPGGVWRQSPVFGG